MYGNSESESDGDTAAAATTTTSNADIGKKTTTTHINTYEFRIMFLRCELFDVAKAARRLINFVEVMYDLYGDLGLQRRIRLNDMEEDELKAIQSGYTQLIKGRDRAGRRILFHFGMNTTNEWALKSRLRTVFYFLMSVADDVETQRKGVVVVQWYQNVNIFNDLSTRGKLHSTTTKAVPFRAGAVHICIPETNIIPAMNSVTVPPSLDTSNSTKGMHNPSTTQSTATTTPAKIIKSMIASSIGSKVRTKLRIHTGK